MSSKFISFNWKPETDKTNRTRRPLQWHSKLDVFQWSDFIVLRSIVHAVVCICSLLFLFPLRGANPCYVLFNALHYLCLFMLWRLNGTNWRYLFYNCFFNSRSSLDESELDSMWMVRVEALISGRLFTTENIPMMESVDQIVCNWMPAPLIPIIVGRVFKVEPFVNKNFITFTISEAAIKARVHY